MKKGKRLYGICIGGIMMALIYLGRMDFKNIQRKYIICFKPNRWGWEIIDLGCGNGLLLKHIICRSNYRLIPHGIDFMGGEYNPSQDYSTPRT